MLSNGVNERLGQAIYPISIFTNDIKEYELKKELDSVPSSIPVCAVSIRLLEVTNLPSGISDSPLSGLNITQQADKLNDAIGKLRVITWQAKRVNTIYPLFMKIYLNLQGSETFITSDVTNSHNPIFDHIALFSLKCLQGDLFCVLFEMHSVRASKPIGQVTIPIRTLVDLLNPLDRNEMQTSHLGGNFLIFYFFCSTNAVTDWSLFYRMV